MPDRPWIVKEVRRSEDMSPDGFLKIFQTRDGDIHVVVCQSKDRMDGISQSVEFCTPISGGGRSPNVRDALLKLMEAIEKDNKENPIDKEEKE